MWVSEEECSVLQSQASGSACMLTIPSTSSHTTAWTHKNVYCTHWYSGGGTVTGMGSTAPVAAVVLLLLLLVLLL